MSTKITIDTLQLNKIVKGLGQFEKEMPGAAISALNRTLDYVNTRVGRIVTAEYNIKVSDIRASITKNKAGRGKLRAFLLSRGRPLTFSHFRISRGRGKRKIVKVKIKKSEGFKQINTDPKAFVQTLNGRTHVLKRKGNTRYPVEVLRTLSIPQMIDSLKISEQIQTDANNKLAERIDHEINRRLKKVKPT